MMYVMEEQLIKKLRKGDEKAFRLLYDRHYVLLCRFANQILNNAALAEEVVDDVIFYLWEHREELHLSSFLSPESMDFLDFLFVDDKQPLGMLLEQELEDELKRSIDELPLECRRVFYKSRFEQKKYEEIAEELGISVNTVKYHIKNALAFLQKRLGNYLKLLIVYIFMSA